MDTRIYDEYISFSCSFQRPGDYWLKHIDRLRCPLGEGDVMLVARIVGGKVLGIWEILAAINRSAQTDNDL